MKRFHALCEANWGVLQPQPNEDDPYQGMASAMSTIWILSDRL